MPTTRPDERVRFGIFEADLRSGELYKRGRRIKLHQQPLQVLALLIERPGDVVTRDELRRKLWPADTFVNFDIGLNSAVRKLRGALNDSAESPRYVETLPRRGYRFIAPVVTPSVSVVESETQLSETQSEGTAEPAFERSASLVAFWERRTWLTGALAALALALVIPLAWPGGGNRRQSSLADATPVRI